MVAQTKELLQEQGLRPPKRLTLAITGACNLKCFHCWVDAGSSVSARHVSTSRLSRLIEEFASLGGEEICFTGGEPLCHPDWMRLMERALTYGFRTVSLQTNGTLLKDEDVRALAATELPGLSIQISLDGTTEPTHDMVRGQGAFAGAVRAVKALAQAGLARHISIFFTEMHHNLAEFPELLTFADSLNLGSVIAGGLVVCGRASEDFLISPPSVDQYVRLLEQYERDAHFRELYDKIGTMASLEWRRQGDSSSECCTFVDNIYITARGLLYPCVLCHVDDYAVSGLFEKSLAGAFIEGIPLWSALLQISRRRVDTIESCQTCSGRTACRAGCMGRAWGASGNLLAPDDRCSLRQRISQRQTD